MEKNEERLRRAKYCIEGLSVGDAFGEQFFIEDSMAEQLVENRVLPPAPWYFTDDTLMTLSIFSILRQVGEIAQEQLAKSFAQRYEFSRGYGPAMHRLLSQIAEGRSWKEVSKSLFAGQGSFGNGAAMRVAPIGAYFADDLDAVVQQAYLSAEITHAHDEAIAGAIAVAVATAWAWKLSDLEERPSYSEFLDLILPLVPKSEVSGKIRIARDMHKDASLQFAISVLGNGTGLCAQDTVPFSLWCVAHHINSYEQALWLTVGGQGDRDTTCAIVGGIVVMYAGLESVPSQWLSAREPLPLWAFQEVLF